MKKITLLLLTLFSQAFAQNNEFELNVNNSPDIIIQSNNETEETKFDTNNNSDVLFVQNLIPKADSWQMMIQKQQKDYSQITTALLVHNINQVVINSYTMLHLSGMQNNLELTQFALSHHASTISLSKNNDTPLDWAAASKNSLILKTEIESLSKKDISSYLNKVNKDGKNTLHFNALYAGNLDIAQMLIDNKVNINAEDINGQTPLDYAIVLQKWKLAELLLKNGANINIKNKNNNTPEDDLFLYGNIDGFQILYSYLSNNKKQLVEDKLNYNLTTYKKY